MYWKYMFKMECINYVIVCISEYDCKFEYASLYMFVYLNATKFINMPDSFMPNVLRFKKIKNMYSHLIHAFKESKQQNYLIS